MFDLYIDGWFAPATCMCDASDEMYLLELANVWHYRKWLPVIQQAEVDSGIELGCGEDLYVVAPTPLARHSGKVRVTHYKNGKCAGPVNEEHYSDFASAILQLTRYKQLDVATGKLDAWLLEPRFCNGFKIAALTEQFNLGKIKADYFYQEMSRLAA